MTKQEAISFIRNIEIECEQCPYYGECDDDFLLCVGAKDIAIECIEKIDKIRFICNFEVGSRHEICDKILAVIDGSDNE